MSRIPKPILNRVTLIAFDQNFEPIPIEEVPESDKNRFIGILLRIKRENDFKQKYHFDY
jgi:hypothetical protein